MSNKLITCKSCGAEIAASAKTCPKCGAKNKKPIYKKWWFYVLIVFILIGVIGGAGGNNATTAVKTESNVNTTTQSSQSKATPEPVTYEHHNVTELFDALKANAMKAQSTYKGQYVELEGFLGTIDSDGKYIGLGAGERNYDYLFQEVQCYIKSDEQKKNIMELNQGDPLVIRGKIKDVGEIFGYSLVIDSIG